MNGQQDFSKQPGFSLRPGMMPHADIPDEELPPFVKRMSSLADQDESQFSGNMQVVRKPTLMQAISGIENGDYEGLEMMDFGAVADGTPAVAFTDEDGQRQVLRLTIPQWFGALESRSRARKELQQAYELDAKKQAFMPYFRAMADKVTEAQDPEIAPYLLGMYDMDPRLAIDQLGSFVRNKPDSAGRTMWKGKAVPIEFAQRAMQLDQRIYSERTKQFDAMARGLQDKPYGLSMLQGVRMLVRTPEDTMQPFQTTLVENVAMQGGGVFPIVNLIQAMKTPGMIPAMPAPVVLPRANEKGEYNEQEFMSFLDTFNEVSRSLGWGPVLGADEQGISTLVDVLNIANKTDGVLPRLPAAQQIVPATVQREQMRAERSTTRQKETEDQAAGSDDQVIMDAATMIGMGDGDAETIVDGIISAASRIRTAQANGTINELEYDAQQRQAILRAELALRKMAGQTR